MTRTSASTDTPSADSPAGRGFWWLCAVAAPPVAIAAAMAGMGMVSHDPARDLAVLYLASVAEEIVFRGALQPALARGLGRRDDLLPWLTASNVVTGIVFAVMHLWRHPPLAALAVFPVSLVYGIARERSGRVWPAALLHVYFDGSLYAASMLVAATRL